MALNVLFFLLKHSRTSPSLRHQEGMLPDKQTGVLPEPQPTSDAEANAWHAELKELGAVPFTIPAD